MTIQKQSLLTLWIHTHKIVKNDSPIFKDTVEKKRSQLQLNSSAVFFRKKSSFATKPLTKPKGKTIFQKANKTQKEGSRQVKIIPQNSAVAKQGGKSNSQSSLEKTFKKSSES